MIDSKQNMAGVNLPPISVVVVDSRSKVHPDWVDTCIKSIQAQVYFNEIQLVVVDNTDKSMSIGKAFNVGVENSTGEYVLFVGDDDWLAKDYVLSLAIGISSNKKIYQNIVGVTSYAIFSDPELEISSPITRCPTGMWSREFLLENKFNENLKNNIDTEYFERIARTGMVCVTLPYNQGYFYRQHGEQVSGRTPLRISKDKPETVDMGSVFDSGAYFIGKIPQFLEPIVDRYKLSGKHKDNILFKQDFFTNHVRSAKVVWVDWADENAVKVAQTKTDAKKILRIHRYEVYEKDINYLDFNKFDHIVFVGQHILDYIESKRGRIDNAIVIPNGVDLNKYTISDNKVRNNNIAWAGLISRRKGVDNLLLIANSLKNYNFYIKGKFHEKDVYEHFVNKCPKNVFVEEWGRDGLNDFFKDKTYILNTALSESQGMSIMEGMACGLKPIIFDWVGSSDIYPSQYIYNSIDDIKNILDGDYKPEEYREFIEKHYNFEDIYPQLEALIDG